ncbi:dolichyl pyrophosphate Man9GlcNAc2 alpha-1,3-glucosyltransferase [Diaphorina citri]|jgi:ALG6, ALG8 glycosyltransferase family.|uniref:Alpha-1,3-glucosyltransferase n=1 Tax=Diaphorina citri TaxID=121845 RepID=A0A1S3DD47_DIACI|nr:dolichyl pyrophosphate Man9GlcNAc2 alpha-1,3-glucosyltransferase [Diaphorina citri]KAI5729194.1 hypothetical protein M8J76_000063 [Diaphorina citri]
MGSKHFVQLLPLDQSQQYISFLLIVSGLLLRWLTSLHPYSGQGKPPMFGDYEAQRHWMEITRHLPVSTWYQNTTDNDLLYWGLDYPPLTAYHSLLCGYVAEYFVPDGVKLFTSHGHESYQHKYFMRLCVLVSDVLIYIPALLCFFSRTENSSSQRVSQTFVLSVALIYPGLILIDHGHFQFNCISLGLFIWACHHLHLNNPVCTAILFSLSVNYKQMELYHALPFFFYYLGHVYHTTDIRLLLTLGSSVLITFILVWLPFLSVSQLGHVMYRLFPIYRGLFEDKVANFWCSANVVYKFTIYMTNDQMALMCLCTTLLAILPSCVSVFRKPNVVKFQQSLIVVSLGFFLFSFHVHEKSILLVSTPVILYLPRDPFPCVWFLFISTFSMFDLYIKDNLVLPSLTLMALYYTIIHDFARKSRLVYYIFLGSLLGCVLLMCIALGVAPPPRYQHLFSLFIATYSFGHFALFFVYFYCKQLDFKFKYIKLL